MEIIYPETNSDCILKYKHFDIVRDKISRIKKCKKKIIHLICPEEWYYDLIDFLKCFRNVYVNYIIYGSYRDDDRLYTELEKIFLHINGTDNNFIPILITSYKITENNAKYNYIKFRQYLKEEYCLTK